MEFAKYYNVTGLVAKMVKDAELTAYGDTNIVRTYVCNDTHDFWVARVIEGYDADYEQREGSYLVERNKIDKYDLLDAYFEKNNIKHEPCTSRGFRDALIKEINTTDLIKMVLIMDDEAGLENWDNKQAYSLEDIIDIIDDGYGIIELKEYC